MERGRWCEQFGIPWAPDDKFPDPFPAYTGDVCLTTSIEESVVEHRQQQADWW
jgi:hypothetical protein